MGIAITTNVSKLAAMVRVCNTGWAYNVLRNIDPILLFTILNTVVSRAIFSSSECQFKSFRRLMTVLGSSSLAVFLQIWQLTTVLLQYRGNAFEYVGPTRCRFIPDKDERG